MSRQRFAVFILLLACICGLVAGGLALNLRPMQVEIVDVALGALLGSLTTALGFYFRS